MSMYSLYRMFMTIEHRCEHDSFCRPPLTFVADCVTELHAWPASSYRSVIDRLLLWGDVNCPGVDGSTVNTILTVALQEFGLTEHIRQAPAVGSAVRHHCQRRLTRYQLFSLSEKQAGGGGCISDHRLVLVSIDVQSAVKKPAANKLRVRI